MMLSSIPWSVLCTSSASCRCSWTFYLLWLCSNQRSPYLCVKEQVTCTIFGYMLLPRWLLKFPSCCSYHLCFWSSFTLQSVSRTNSQNSSSFTWFWRLWFRLQPLWATSYHLLLIQRQQLLLLPLSWICHYPCLEDTWSTFTQLKENGLKRF